MAGQTAAKVNSKDRTKTKPRAEAEADIPTAMTTLRPNHKLTPLQLPEKIDRSPVGSPSYQHNNPSRLNHLPRTTHCISLSRQYDQGRKRYHDLRTTARR